MDSFNFPELLRCGGLLAGREGLFCSARGAFLPVAFMHRGGLRFLKLLASWYGRGASRNTPEARGTGSTRGCSLIAYIFAVV
jgi:hypothetical protein